MLGYLTHPLVGAGLLLEHGCEKTHNDWVRARLREAGVDPARYGWASIQLDGGIAAVGERVEAWFTETLAELEAPGAEPVGLAALRLGLAAGGPISPEAAASLAVLVRAVVGAGGTVVVPDGATILQSPAFLDATLGGRAPAAPTIAYGEVARLPGLHVMETPTDHWVETLTGLGATGAEIVLVHTTGGPVQGHRMLPVIQVTADAETAARSGADLDLVLDGEPALWADQLLGVVRAVASREFVPKAVARRDTDFQLTRGLLGVSM
jgi:altronate dehydratase